MTTTKEEEFKDEDFKIIFYCKDCEQIVDTNKVGRKYVYECKKCGTKNVAFGTTRSINGFFRLDEKEKMRLQQEKRAKRLGDKT